MGLVRERRIQLVTFDGDVTLYDDGEALLGSNPVIPRIISLLQSGTKVGIVTAAGYTDASKYYERLHGLLDALASAVRRGDVARPELVVLGGESNYLFEFDVACTHLLRYIPGKQWMLEEMQLWTEADVTALLDVAEGALRDCIANMHLQADILRKERAVGIVPTAGGRRIAREQLEETVLVTQQVLEMSAVGKRLPFCAFNGLSLPFERFRTSWLNMRCKEVVMSSSTSATSPGASSVANASLAASTGPGPCMLATSFCRRVPMISRSRAPVQPET